MFVGTPLYAISRSNNWGHESAEGEDASPRDDDFRPMRDWT